MCISEMMDFPEDILTRIRIDYPSQTDYALVKSALSELEVDEKLRVVRCILFASNGSLEKVLIFVNLAKKDYRDVIIQGEYEYPSNKKVRNLNEPFIDQNT